MKLYYNFRRAGFSLVELLVVMAIMVIVGVIGFRTYDQFIVKGRDEERRTVLNRFAKQLEFSKNEFGAYVCGDDCFQKGIVWYTYDCSDTVPAGVNPGNDPKEVPGFLNGGDCCNLAPHNYGGSPAPTSITDALNWGLYAGGYLESSWPKDPLNVFMDPLSATDKLPRFYCYAAPANGRDSYKLFARMEQDSSGASDGGACTKWYELSTGGYPVNGFKPDDLPANSAWGCN